VPRQAIAAVLLLGLLTACGEDPAAPAAEERPDSSPSAPSTPTSAPAEPATPSPTRPARATGTRIITEDSHVGTVLFDETGQAVYVFDVETTSEPRCYGTCAEAWPPVLTDGAPRAGTGVAAERLGTTRRKDGSTQVTYAGRPLYFYAHEGKHVVECHDVSLDGGTWYALQPDGRTPP
jgi:predicted lipoprotein with Yx(FWY)xxD motif